MALNTIEQTNQFQNHIGGVIVIVVASTTVYRGFEPRSGQTKDYEIDIAASPLGTQI